MNEFSEKPKTPEEITQEFRSLIPEVSPKVAKITKEQQESYGHEWTVAKFGEFAKKQRALAYRLLKLAEKSNDPESVMQAAMIIFYSIEAQAQTNLTEKNFRDK